MISAQLIKQLHGSQGPFSLDITCQVAPGELLAVYGPSGAGKTTLLRCLAGLTHADSGYIRCGNQSWFDQMHGIQLPVQQRRVGFLFQDYALFPNMTVREQLLYALPKGDDKRRVDRLLEMVGLGACQQQKPASLSGGQKQRVALIRMLAARPQIMLLDEPLSALDTPLRVQLQSELRAIHQQCGLMTLLVSHDVREVCTLADRVLLLEAGQVTQQGVPMQVFAATASTDAHSVRAEVLAKTAQGAGYLVHVLVGQQILTLHMTVAQAQQVEVGGALQLPVGEFPLDKS